MQCHLITKWEGRNGNSIWLKVMTYAAFSDKVSPFTPEFSGKKFDRITSDQ